MHDAKNKSVLSVSEFAEAYGLSRATAYALTKRADFPAAKLGKRVVIPIESLERWLAKGGTEQRGA